jgi:Bacterial lectin/IPT/TIG domain
MCRPFILALVVALACALAPTASAQSSFFYPDFSSLAGITTNGSAVQGTTGTELTITQGASQAGSAYWNQLIPIGGGFDTFFNFRVSPGATGGTLADGFAFVIHNDPAADTYVGVNGGQLGYGPNLMNGLVVEFDSYVNGGVGDTSNNEISIHVNAGAVDNNESLSIGQVTPAVNINDGLLHTCRILHNPPAAGMPGVIEVFIDDLMNPVLSVPFDFLSGGNYATGAMGAAMPPALNDFQGYVGFSGGTGAFSQLTEILDWQWTSLPGRPLCYQGNVSDGAGGIADILTINGSNGGFFRKTDIDLFTPFTLELATPPTNAGASPIALFGIIGVPDQTTAYSTPYGDLCFPPPFILPAPWIFTITDSLITSPALLPPSFTPFTLPIPGLDVASQITFQAGVLEDSTNPLSVAISNAVILDLKPLDPPVITSISPLFPLPGDTVTISGTGFNPNMLCGVAGVLVPLTVVNDTTATFVAGGPYPCDTMVDIANPDLQLAQTFLFPSPLISGFPISSGPAAGGNIFAISGMNLGPNAIVDFDGLGVPTLANSPGVITGNVPPGTSGQVATVTVTNAGGCQASTTYTYQ